MRDVVIQIEHLDFAYGETLALQDVCLTVCKGEFIGLFGPNGGGKTTLLKLLMDFLAPTRGTVHLFGSSPKAMRTRIGYVPQHRRFDSTFPISALEVVLLGCLSKLRWGHFSFQLKERAREALQRVGLSHKASVPFGTLSGGEAQRVLIARAIVNAPELLLLDEPTSNIDPQAEQLIYQLLAELNQTMTILMVSHDLQTILNRVRRFICIQRRVTPIATKELCEHFALGLYHTPLTSHHHFNL
jgi:zinc transport system ATP-binding protein